MIVYECGICDCYHPWEWDGDCRDDANRLSSDYIEALERVRAPGGVEVRSMEDRLRADAGLDWVEAG